jgi:Clp amino terminal domain, pathogenicity island component
MTDYTPAAGRAIMYALEEAIIDGRGFLGTGDLLLGIIRSDGGAAQALADCGLGAVRLDEVRQALRAHQSKYASAAPNPEPVATPHYNGVIALTGQNADLRGQEVGTEQLLLAMFQGGAVLLDQQQHLQEVTDGTPRTAVVVLGKLGVDPLKLTVALNQRLTGKVS